MVMKAPVLHPEKPETRTIAAGEFKAKCLQLMDEVNEKGLTLIVTKRGKPVAQVAPPAQEAKPFRPIWGRTPDIKILGDIVSPLPQELTLPEWAWEKPAPKSSSRRGKR